MKQRSSSPSTSPTSFTTLYPLRLRLLKLLLAFGTLAIVVTWCFEAWSERINPIDRVAYPTMVALFVAYLISIKLHALDQARVTGFELAVILLDIDHFKRVNDTYGHAVGDQVLIDIAGLLRQQLRATDTLGRWGGEEFMVVVTETNLGATVQLAERLRTLIADHSKPPVGQVTVSFGVAMAIPGDTPDALVKRADEALYRAKQHGRNRVEVAGPLTLN